MEIKELKNQRADKTGAGMLGSPALYMLVYLSLTGAKKLPWRKIMGMAQRVGLTLHDVELMADAGWLDLQRTAAGGVMITITQAGDECVRNMVDFFRLGGAGK